MHAIVDATPTPTSLESLLRKRPAALLRIGDKPLLHHIIEQLISLGTTSIDLVIHDFPERIQQSIGDGKRWGISVNYHLCKDSQYPFHPLSESYSSPVFVARADCIPNIPVLDSSSNLALIDSKGNWTGWAFYPNGIHSDVAAVPAGCIEKQVNLTVQLDSAKSLVFQNIHQLSQSAPPLLMPSSAKQVEPGIWISRGTVLDPKADITGPVFLGEHCHIHAGSHVGPNAIIESGSIVANHSTVTNSLICQNSYIGEGLTIKDSVIDGNQLINFHHDTHIQLADDFILSHLHIVTFEDRLWRGFGRIIAAVLFLMLLPLLVILFFIAPPKGKKILIGGRRGAKRRERTLWLFSLSQESIGYIFLNRLAALYNVIRGDLHLFGIAPITLEQYQEMPTSWQEVISRSKSGWITIFDLEGHAPLDKEQWQASQAYYAAQSGFRFDLHLLWNWCKKGLGLQRYV